MKNIFQLIFHYTTKHREILFWNSLFPEFTFQKETTFQQTNGPEQQNFYTCTVIDKEKKRKPFNLWKCNELTLSHTAICISAHWLLQVPAVAVYMILDVEISPKHSTLYWETRKPYTIVANWFLSAAFLL